MVLVECPFDELGALQSNVMNILVEGWSDINEAGVRSTTHIVNTLMVFFALLGCKLMPRINE